MCQPRARDDSARSVEPIAKATRIAKGVARSVPFLAEAADILRLERFKYRARRWTTPQLAERFASPTKITLRADRVIMALEGTLDATQATSNWDACARPIEQTGVYRALAARFADGHPTASGPPVGAPGRGMQLGIGRDGDVICIGGLDQLCMAKILGVESIDAVVTLRHKKWQEFVKQILSYASEKCGCIYHVIDHPDLSDIPAIHGWSRIKMIKDALPLAGGRVLDIGCHWGFYCHQLEQAGFDCVGVELERRHAYFAQKIRRAVRGSYRIEHGSLFDIDKDEQFDVVIALYIFHHLVKTSELHDRLVRFLENLKARVMIFGSHNYDQEAMQTAYRNYTSEEWVDFLLEKSVLRNARIIGTENYGSGKRDLFLLEV